jgi:hypothetical protein
MDLPVVDAAVRVGLSPDEISRALASYVRSIRSGDSAFDVIDFYDRGGNANPHLDAEIRPAKFASAERRALGAFLRSLNGRVQEGARWRPSGTPE